MKYLLCDFKRSVRRYEWQLSVRRVATVHAALVAVVLITSLVRANETSPPPPKVLTVGPEEAIFVQIEPSLQPPPTFEIPPVFVEGAPDLAFVSTGWSWLCGLPNERSTTSLTLGPTNCQRFSTPARLDLKTGRSRSPQEAAARSDDWSRSYYGVFSALKLDRPFRKHDLLTFMHGENKNEIFGSILYNNTVNPGIEAASCASGYKEGLYKDCWPSYNGFISVVLANTTKPRDELLDLGPILWPAMGYYTNGRKTSGGLRHPSVVHSGSNLYIFYLDTSTDMETGQRGGLRVARMRLPSAGESFPIAYPWYEGAFSETNPSLPPGFAREHIRTFFDKRGGRASELWPESWQTVRFAVARISGTALFIGAEEFVANESWGVRLRVSRDLVHWSAPVPLPSIQSKDGWGGGTLHYPVFSNLVGRSTEEVDLAGFYLIGSGPGGRVVQRRISLAL